MKNDKLALSNDSEIKDGDLSKTGRGILNSSRTRVRRSVNSEMVNIFLCADKNKTFVHYTLPENDNRIFAPRYQLYLPAEEEIS